MVSVSFIITQQIEIQRFLDACSDSQLHEIQLLLNSHRYQKRMYPDDAEIVDAPTQKPVKPYQLSDTSRTISEL